MITLKSPAADQMINALMDHYHPKMRLTKKECLAEAFRKALSMGVVNAWWLEREENSYEERVKECEEQQKSYVYPTQKYDPQRVILTQQPMGLVRSDMEIK